MRAAELHKSSAKQRKTRLKRGANENKETRETKEWEGGLRAKEHDYLASHHRIKAEYHNREYKYACDLAFDLAPPHPEYLPLYYEDQLTSVNKVLKSLIIRNQLSVEGSRLYFERGEVALFKFYQIFIKDELITSSLKAVKGSMKGQVSKFLMAVICFLTRGGFLKSAQAKPAEAMSLYQFGYALCTNIISSSTSNYKLLKKATECLLCYSAFLIDRRATDDAIQVLLACLKNETNIATILAYRFKNKSKNQAKNMRTDLYNRLHAALFNLAQCYHAKQLLPHSYFFLAESQLISQLKIQTAQLEIKTHLGSLLLSLKQIYQQHRELNIIASGYFSLRQIHSAEKDKACTVVQKHCKEPVKSEQSMLNEDELNQPPKPNKNLLKRSISLQDKLNQINTKKIIKQFGKQILFFGTGVFESKKPKDRSTVHVRFRQPLQNDQRELSKAYLVSEFFAKPKQQLKTDNRLKKRGKVARNTEFLAVRQPIEYQVLQKRVQNMWKDQSLQANKTKQKIYLLRYKSQYLNCKQIAKQNKHLFEEIQVCNNRQVPIRQPTKPAPKKEQQSASGINLFKQLLLKHAKKFMIKKSETLYVLKKKSTSFKDPNSGGKTYSASNQSINFLLERLKRQKDRYIAKQPRKVNYLECDYRHRLGVKAKDNVSSVFLTKDTVQMPNLFISYITSETVSTDILSAVLQYGMNLQKHKTVNYQVTS